MVNPRCQSRTSFHLPKAKINRKLTVKEQKEKISAKPLVVIWILLSGVNSKNRTCLDIIVFLSGVTAPRKEFTMSGVRLVVDCFTVPLDPRRGCHVPLPLKYLEKESNKQRLLDVWNDDVLKAINDICLSRRSRNLKKNIRKVIFRLGMEKICSAFNLRTTMFKVEFHVHKSMDNPNKENYSLLFTLLSDIPDHIRTAGHPCIAEIPPVPPPTPVCLAEFVESTELLVSTSTDVLNAAVVQVLPETPPSPRSAAPRTPSSTQPTALQRMQELQSIREYLTQEEYQSKRKQILDSI